MESHSSSLGASPAPDSPITTGHHLRSAKTLPQIKIEPTCLVFPPPHYGRCIQNAISIYNVSKQPCVYKMRSQNPERYVAKPHVAIVAPESARRIFVTLRDMNTLGTKNLPEDTNDRFRISLRLYDPATVDASLAPKELWNVLQQRGSKVDHEQDLVSYFTKMDTPVGGLVTFFPPTYIPVTPTAIGKGGEGAAAAGANGTQTNASAQRGLTSDLNAATSAQQRKTAPPPAAAAAAGGKRKTSGGAEAAAAKGNRMPAVWVGVAVAALVVVSLAVAVGVTLRGSVPPPPAAAAAPRGVSLEEAPAWVQEAAAPFIRAVEKAEGAAQARREEEAQARLAAEAEQARWRREEEEWARVQQQQQQQQQQQEAAEARAAVEREAARERAAEEEGERARAAEAQRQYAQQQQQEEQRRAEELTRAAHEQRERDEADRLQQQQREQQQQEQQQQEQQQRWDAEAHVAVEPQVEHAAA